MVHLSFTCLVVPDGFGDKGKPACGDEVAVPPNATLHITLELVSWRTVSDLTDDKKVIKKILKEGEGYERPNEGAVVKGRCFFIELETHVLLIPA
jgi:FK506-binding protein 4/5